MSPIRTAASHSARKMRPMMSGAAMRASLCAVPFMLELLPSWRRWGGRHCRRVEILRPPVLLLPRRGAAPRFRLVRGAELVDELALQYRRALAMLFVAGVVVERQQDPLHRLDWVLRYAATVAIESRDGVHRIGLAIFRSAQQPARRRGIV